MFANVNRLASHSAIYDKISLFSVRIVSLLSFNRNEIYAANIVFCKYRTTWWNEAKAFAFHANLVSNVGRNLMENVIAKAARRGPSLNTKVIG